MLRYMFDTRDILNMVNSPYISREDDGTYTYWRSVPLEIGPAVGNKLYQDFNFPVSYEIDGRALVAVKVSEYTARQIDLAAEELVESVSVKVSFD